MMSNLTTANFSFRKRQGGGLIPYYLVIFVYYPRRLVLDSTKVRAKTGLKTKEILADYHLAVASREASLIGRKEVFMGKAKFGIFGDGKEVAQIAMAKYFKTGDFRSGYYRDQTFMFAIGELTLQQYFAQLYAHTDLTAEPASAGRQMNGHFATRMYDADGELRDLTKSRNVSADISPTGGQMPRLIGLAWASKLFRGNKELQKLTTLSNKGNEVAFGTIGNASTSEGMFFEAMNAAGVLQIPIVISIWDDYFGISVPQEFHTTKLSISKALEGMKRTVKDKGIEIRTAKGWDYEGLLRTYKDGVEIARKEHVPVLIHVEEMTQPQGHSTSGSHERYKSKQRLAWEDEFDCIAKMKEWILSKEFATIKELEKVEGDARNEAKRARSAAWKEYTSEIEKGRTKILEFLSKAASESSEKGKLLQLETELTGLINPFRSDILRISRKTLRLLRNENIRVKQDLKAWISKWSTKAYDDYSSHVYSESKNAAVRVERVSPVYSDTPDLVDGREVLQACFDHALGRDPRVIAFGEDLGKIGDVNQGFAGLQAKYGSERVLDTGIRETTILGQGIGTAMRGLRPIAEIQYMDYLLYAIQIISDDLATLEYRTKGGQKAPLIIRTRGHRLEGMWHSGSPMSMILGSVRGIYVLVPRNMTKAAAFYNTMLKSDDPALIVECLNGYRLKEQLPQNVGEITEPVGIPEIIREGSDITVVTYGSMCRIVMEAAIQLEDVGISVEIIDIQTLLPFDIHHQIAESVKKTNRVVFADEDVPGGATAYMMTHVLEDQGAYRYLDSPPVTITSKDHRPAYGTDGDYFSKPNVEELFDRIYEIMSEVDPVKYADIY